MIHADDRRPPSEQAQAPEHEKPETEPINPNTPPQPKRQDDGQQTPEHNHAMGEADVTGQILQPWFDEIRLWAELWPRVAAVHAFGPWAKGEQDADSPRGLRSF